MRPWDQNAVDGVAAALYSLLSSEPPRIQTIQQVHEMWNAWPDKAQPISLTAKALRMLQADGVVERVGIAESPLWRRTSAVRPTK